MKRVWSVAWRNLRRNRRRNLATAAAIAMGYAGLVVLGGYSSRVEHFLRTAAVYLQHSGHVTIYLDGGFQKAHAEPERYQLDPAAQAKILALAARDDRVEFAGRYLRGVGLAGNGCSTQPTSVLGVEPATLARTSRHAEVLNWCPELGIPVKGKWMDQYPDLPNAAAVSAGLAILLKKPGVHDETLGREPAPAVLHCETPLEDDELSRDADVQLVSLTYDGMSNAVDTEMVATFHGAEPIAEDGSMITSLATLQTLYATDRVTYVALFLHRADDAAAVAADIQRTLAADGLRVEALPYDDERTNPYYVGSMAFLGAMVGFITILVSLVLMLTVLGAMTLTILERTREIGTWRALGFTRGHLTGLVVREALLLALTGLGAGLLIGLGASLGINNAGIRFEPPGIPGTIALVVYPSARICALQAALIIPGVCVAAWAVVRGQVKRNLVDLLTSQTG